MPTVLSKNEQIALQIASSLCAGRFQNEIPNKSTAAVVVNSFLEVYDAALEILKKRSK